MKLTFLGSGSAFTVGKKNYQSNMILEIDGYRLLIDCGTDARYSLYEAGLAYGDIDAIYISHLHADHVGGLEWLAFCTYFDPDCKKPTLYIAKNLAKKLWDHVLSGGLSSLEDKEATLSTYFKVVLLEDDAKFTWRGIKFTLVKTFHTISNGKLCPSYGFTATYKTHHLFVTTDTKLCFDQLKKHYLSASVIFHDCETAKVPTGVHAHFNDLKHLDPAIKAKTWLYHHSSGRLPHAKKEGFPGFVKKGQSFTFD